MIPKQLSARPRHGHLTEIVVEAAAADAAEVCRRFDTRPEGLADEEAERRLAEQGPTCWPKTSGRAWRRSSRTRS